MKYYNIFNTIVLFLYDNTFVLLPTFKYVLIIYLKLSQYLQCLYNKGFKINAIINNNVTLLYIIY